VVALATWAAILSPIGLIVGAVAGLGAAFLSMTEAGARTRGELATHFENIRETAVTAWGGIVDAIKAGDFALAGRIAMLGLKMVWMEVVASLKDVWAGFTGFFLGVWDKALGGWLLIFNEIGAGIKTQWASVVAFILNLWNTVVGAVKGAFRASEGEGLRAIEQAEKLGFVSKEEADKARAAWKDQNKERSGEVGGADRADEIERDRRLAVQNIEVERDARRKEIHDKVAGNEAGRKQQRDANLAEAAAEFDAAKAQLGELADEAREKREAMQAKAAEAGKPGPGVGEALTGKPTGTFSAEAARSLGGEGGVARQIALAQQQVEQARQQNAIAKDILAALGGAGALQ